jgi:transcriptional regulator of acetoin/glycerol metabolism
VDDLPLELREFTSPTTRRGPGRKLNAQSVQEALTIAGGNKAKAARILGVGRATLYRFLADHPELH